MEPSPGLVFERLLCRKTSKGQSRTILRDVSLQCHQSISVVVGASGSGKSTLLRCLVGLDEFQNGTLSLDGQTMDQVPIQEWRRQIGLVLQLPYLFDGSVAENILYGPRLHQQSINNEPERVEELLNLVQLETSLAERHANQLSVGQQMRVSIARTLANNPKVILLDEPTASLDQDTTSHVLQMLHAVHRERKMTIIIVSHDPAVADLLPARTFELHEGVLHQKESGSWTP